MEQLDFFELTEDIDTLQEVRKLEEKQDNLSRGMFGRFDKLLTKTLSLEEKLDIIMNHLQLTDDEIMEKKIFELPLFELK
tara:strand:+ start:6999 stop:7238 length:240 start_codon:yes stop_codon:yes gene_type:complete